MHRPANCPMVPSSPLPPAAGAAPPSGVRQPSEAHVVAHGEREGGVLALREPQPVDPPLHQRAHEHHRDAEQRGRDDLRHAGADEAAEKAGDHGAQQRQEDDG